MNYSIIINLCGRVIGLEGIFMLLPLLTAICCGEAEGHAFIPCIVGCLIVGIISLFLVPRNKTLFAREGFVTVALSWIIISMIGALPFVISGDIPDYTDALFETVSGFTTTGASILGNVESLSRCCLMWRSFTHWVGGMGVLVFMLAVVRSTSGQEINLMKAESPGPSVGKLVPRIRTTAFVLYAIYSAMTVFEIILLALTGMPLFDAICMSFGSAGTGGFGIRNSSAADYTTLQQAIISVSMMLFGVNFNVYYLLTCKRWREALKCEEARVYFAIIIGAIALITLNVASSFDSLFQALHHVTFQVGSIITTTGFSTVDFDAWPFFSKNLLIILMFIGACAGSTGGGLKVSRVIVLLKSVKKELRLIVQPREIRQIYLEGKPLSKNISHSIYRFLITYILVFTISVVILSLENMDFASTFTAVAATINNIGPGLVKVGPACNFGFLTPLSKYVLIFDMLAGRLEIMPMVILLMPATWRANYNISARIRGRKE